MKKLIIAEKPSVARDIGRVLGCSGKANGYIYNDKYIITWAVGHLVTLCDPDDYDPKLKKWRMDTLPIVPKTVKLKAYPQTRDQLKVIYNLIKKEDVEELICATDSGREGELIFRYIYNITNCDKPFSRLWISSMTDAAIKSGFENLKPGSNYNDLYLSAKCRSEADWLVGINASRAFTLKYNSLLTIGRVQTPTLAIIVNRQKEIDTFVPQEYYEVEAEFETEKSEKYKGIFCDKDGKEFKILEKEKSDNIVNVCKGAYGVVESSEKNEKRTPPPLLYDLTELQRDANKKFGFSAQKTLQLVQSLYETRKMVTYPRTDSRYISDDMIPKLKIILSRLNSIPAYKEYSDYILGLEKLPITKRIVDNSKITDHHAIIPTEIYPKVNILSVEEGKVYDLIARRFMAVFYPNYITSVSKIITNISENLFVSRGTQILQDGWTKLNLKDQKEKKNKEIILPDFLDKKEVKCGNIKFTKKKTAPPKPYDEASLLSAMENAGRFVEDDEIKEQLKDSGLGTPATRAGIIERLLSVGYITRNKKNLVPTEKGKKLIEVVPKELKSPETTGKWEKGLARIAEGKMETDKFMASIIRYINFLVDFSKNTPNITTFPIEKSRK